MVKRDDLHTNELYRQLNFFTFMQLTQYHTLLNTYKTIKGFHDINLELPYRNNDIHTYPTRTNNNFQINLGNTMYGRKVPSARFATEWNMLPINLREIPIISTFKLMLKRHLKQ